MTENRVFSFAIFLIGRGLLYIFPIALGCVLIYINPLSVKGKEATFFALNYCGHRHLDFISGVIYLSYLLNEKMFSCICTLSDSIVS